MSDTKINPTSLLWKTPPEISHDSMWTPVADELRKHPGEWAQLPSEWVHSANSTASNIRSGLSSPFRPRGAFEAKTRKGAVYARFVGENGEHAS